MKTGLNWMQCVDVSMWGASSEFICKKNGANFSHEHLWILLILSSFKPKVNCTYTAGGHVSLQQNRSSTTFIHTTEPETLGMNLWVRGQEIRNPDPGKHLLIATKNIGIILVAKLGFLYHFMSFPWVLFFGCSCYQDYIRFWGDSKL